MAKKHVYAKDVTGYGDFIYVDLLPEVRRARQFNMRVIVALLVTITLTFALIYLPYSTKTFELEELNSVYNDKQHELTLTQEEFAGYEIDLNAIGFENDIDGIKHTKADFNALFDDLKILVENTGSRLESVTFNMAEGVIVIDVTNADDNRFNTLNNHILSLDWVLYSVHTDEIQYSGSNLYSVTYTIGVDFDAE